MDECSGIPIAWSEEQDTFLGSLFPNMQTNIQSAITPPIALIIVMLFNIFLFLMLFDFMHILSFLDQKNKLLQYTVFIITLYIPGYFLLGKLITRDIENIEISKKYKKFHSWLLFIYLLVNFTLMILKIIERR